MESHECVTSGLGEMVEVSDAWDDDDDDDDVKQAEWVGGFIK